MKSQYRVVIVGGGVVGASVLYHLAKLGWTDVAIVERSVLTAGSSWHAAGGVHALNADPNMAALQAYTIDLLSEIEKESGQAIDPQSRALDQLQQGMQAMVDSFMERMGQSQPQRGDGPVGMEPGSGRDPLGRSTGQTGLEALEGVEIPDKMELRRARTILNELRRRRSESGRPPPELDYIDRLLRQF